MTGRIDDALVKTAHELADLAGRTVLPFFRRRIAVENKDADGGFDPVTRADKAAERVMRRHIAKAWPGHGIVGEEFAPEAGTGRHEWILDPIDGTKAFITGTPMWGTLIGVLEEGAPLIGMMDQPYTRERFWGSPRGAFLRRPDGKETRIRTRACANLGDAILGTTSPDLFRSKGEQEGFGAVARAVRLTRYGGDCYIYCLLAAGHFDVVIEASLKAVDIAPLIPIIERAGGRVTSWTGGPATAGGNVVASGDPTLHEKVLELLTNPGRARIAADAKPARARGQGS
ncbi:MAG: histidinol-phosphatase [Hyphomicrobiales bacterium]|nr:histidinol-phosphatase [Hyphomicrobiales bacterium]